MSAQPYGHSNETYVEDVPQDRVKGLAQSSPVEGKKEPPECGDAVSEFEFFVLAASDYGQGKKGEPADDTCNKQKKSKPQ